MKIENLDFDNRPREKLIKYGPKALSDSELLAIMIGSGNKKMSVIELSNYLINNYGLNRLLNMSFSELSKINGIKLAKATKLMACFELSRRCVRINNARSLLKACDVFEYIKSDFMFYTKEVLVVVYVDSKCRPIKKVLYNETELSASVSIPVRKIISEIISMDAYGIILAHNHPSGDIKPSHTDISATFDLMKILGNIGVKLLDHFVVYENNYFSFIENEIIIK